MCLCFLLASVTRPMFFWGLQLVPVGFSVLVQEVLNDVKSNLYTSQFIDFHMLFANLRQRRKALAILCQLMFLFCVYNF